MKILYVTTIGITMDFFHTFIKQLTEEGNTVDIATNDKASPVSDFYRKLGCNIYQIDTSRSPLNKGNLKAVKQLKALAEKEKYDIVHCHTPIAAMCARIACRKARKNGTRVIYTAHGFHFYKGASLKNWLLFYPIEKLCAHFTDVLVTINKEDFNLAQKKMKAKQIKYVPGVGINLEKFSQITVNALEMRKEIGVPENAKLILSVGELNENKNHETVIRAIANTDFYYAVAGKGKRREELQAIIDELGLTERVKLLGYQTDILKFYQIADVFVLPSFREGLNVSLMEAMASGLPCIASKIRGTVDLIDENGGILCTADDVLGFKTAIEKVLSNKNASAEMGEYNRKKIENFDEKIVCKMMKEIYFS